MPFYEYKAVDKSCPYCIEKFEVYQSILCEAIEICPKCQSPVQRLISLPSGIIMGGREANQYSDIKHAKYWRDKNGIRHPVTAADGHTGATTITKKTATPAQIRDRKRKEFKQGQKDRLALLKRRANEFNKRQQEK